MEKVSLILILAYIVLNALHEKRMRNRIKALDFKLDALKLIRQDFLIDGISEKDCPENLILHLENQAERLKFCYRCPLYRDKVQEDKVRILQEMLK